ncbi:MAG: class I SAM-dependent methyltransferase [Chloroflexota bacterium]
MDIQLIQPALAARRHLLTEPHDSALRLFNGFTEGWPDLTVELYGRTAVPLNQSDPPEALHPFVPDLAAWLRDELPFLRCILLKDRRARDPDSRRGRLLFGDTPDDRILENGVTYALDLSLNQDTSFYLDTRNLRQWLKENMRGRRVLNTFAYSGSLGVAALAGGASRVVQTDRTRRFLGLAKASITANGLRVRDGDLVAGDFFDVAARFRHAGTLFDCVILDPPFFSASKHGRVDLLTEYHRLVNKIRPLIAHDGWLVAINNALFLGGGEYLASLEALCEDGYMSIETLIPVPEDCTGFIEEDFGSSGKTSEVFSQPYPADPAPFNHPTKIAILSVKRKDEKR